MEANVYYFEDFIRKKYKKAYDWVNETIQGSFVEPMSINFENDSLPQNPRDCRAAIFRNEDSDQTLLVRYWPDKMATSYNVIANYNEMKEKAPQSVKTLLDNGIKMFEKQQIGAL